MRHCYLVHLTAHWDELSGQSSVDCLGCCAPIHYVCSHASVHTHFSGANEALGDRTHLKTFLCACLHICLFVHEPPRGRIIYILYIQDISRSEASYDRSPHSFTPIRVFSSFLPLLSLYLAIARVSEAWGVIRVFQSWGGEREKKGVLLLLKKQQLLSYYCVQPYC